MRQVGVEENKIAAVSIDGYNGDVYRLDWTTDVYIRECSGIDRQGYAIANILEGFDVDMGGWAHLTTYTVGNDTVYRFQNSSEEE